MYESILRESQFPPNHTIIWDFSSILEIFEEGLVKQDAVKLANHFLVGSCKMSRVKFCKSCSSEIFVRVLTTPLKNL